MASYLNVEGLTVRSNSDIFHDHLSTYGQFWIAKIELLEGNSLKTVSKMGQHCPHSPLSSVHTVDFGTSHIWPYLGSGFEAVPLE